MDALLIGPALALSFAGTLYAGKALLAAFVTVLEHRSRRVEYIRPLARSAPIFRQHHHNSDPAPVLL